MGYCITNPYKINITINALQTNLNPRDALTFKSTDETIIFERSYFISIRQSSRRSVPRDVCDGAGRFEDTTQIYFTSMQHFFFF